MHISARTDYALRALLEVAASYPNGATMSEIVNAQGLPRSFIEAILPELRRADLVRLSRGGTARYSLARPAEDMSVGSVLRAIDGPFTRVRGLPPDLVDYNGSAREMSALWVAVEASLDHLLEGITLADLVSGVWPEDIMRWAGMLDQPGSRSRSR